MAIPWNPHQWDNKEKDMGTQFATERAEELRKELDDVREKLRSTISQLSESDQLLKQFAKFGWKEELGHLPTVIEKMVADSHEYFKRFYPDANS
jgi:hypothetical protein